MLLESIVILMILGLLAVLFLRRKRRDYAVGVLPLMMVPGFHVLVRIARDLLPWDFSNYVLAGADVLGLAVSVMLLGMISVRLRSKKARAVYLLLCGGFSIVLTLIFLFSLYPLLG